MSPVLETDRLVFRELSLERDLDFIADLLAHPEVMHYWPAPMARAESIEWIEKQRGRYERDGFGYWLVSLKDSSQPIGQAGLMRVVVEGEPHIGLGYNIHADHWGKGYATEAAAACLEHGFKALKMSRIIALIRPENEPSARVAERIGMTPAPGTRTQFAGFEHVIFTIERDSGSILIERVPRQRSETKSSVGCAYDCSFARTTRFARSQWHPVIRGPRFDRRLILRTEP